MNTLATFLIGVYLLVVTVRGNSKELISLAVRDKGFLKWGVAVLILLYLRSIKILGKDFNLLIIMAFIGLFINNGDKISEGFKKIWSNLGV